MFENPRRGRQARNFTKNVPKILDLKSSSEQIFSDNWRWVPLKKKNALSSLLEDTFCCQKRRCCATNFSFGIQNECYMSHCKYSKGKKCKKRQAAHLSFKPLWNLWKPSTYWCSSENSFRDFTLTKLNDDFYQYQGPSINIYSFFVADQDTARDSICMFNTGKCISLAEPYTIDSSFSSCVFLLNLLPVL